MDNLHPESQSNLKRTHLIRHLDERGFFQEILRSSDIRQVSHSFMHKGVKKEGHLHGIQTDWWYVVTGELKVFLSKETWQADFIMHNELLQIPPGVVHGCEALTDVNLLYICSHTYNPEDDLRWQK